MRRFVVARGRLAAVALRLRAAARRPLTLTLRSALALRMALLSVIAAEVTLLAAALRMTLHLSAGGLVLRRRPILRCRPVLR